VWRCGAIPLPCRPLNSGCTRRCLLVCGVFDLVRRILILYLQRIRTRAAALKARNSAFLEGFQDLLLLTETCCH
jgi:hypothetical protein